MTEVQPTYDTGPDPDVEDGPEPFLAALQKALRPEVLARAGDELARVIRSVQAHGKKATLTLTIALQPMKNNPEVAEVTAKVKASPAEPPPRATPMWPTPHGRLERNDPRQQQLPGLRPITHEES